MSITIRKADEADFNTLIGMITEFALFQRSSDKMTNTVEQMRDEQHTFTCFVAVTPEHAIVGYAVCVFAYYTWSGKSLCLDDLFVQEAYRGQTIGKRLLTSIVDYAKEENCKKVRWQVSRWNTPAREFYEKFGAHIDDVELNCDFIV